MLRTLKQRWRIARNKSRLRKIWVDQRDSDHTSFLYKFQKNGTVCAASSGGWWLSDQVCAVNAHAIIRDVHPACKEHDGRAVLSMGDEGIYVSLHPTGVMIKIAL